MRRIPVVAVLALLALALVGCGGGERALKDKPLEWRACGSFDCATLTVPLDYSDPEGRTIDLAVIRARASKPGAIGSLVVNPGGPGGGGVKTIQEAAALFPKELRDHFDLVSWDPRGVDGSVPVRCFTPEQLRESFLVDPEPRTAESARRLTQATREWIDRCRNSVSPELLRNLGTSNTVNDLDRLRAALGEEKLNYLGISYGTYLGALYAERFPERVRAMVLDSALDPSLSSAELARQQGHALERELEAFLRETGTRPAYRALDRFFRAGKTLPASLVEPYGDRERAGLATFRLAVGSALYTPSAWPALAGGLRQAADPRAADAATLTMLAYVAQGLQLDGSWTNLASANPAIRCLDRPSSRPAGGLPALAARWEKEAPNFGAFQAWEELDCNLWPVRGTNKPHPIRAPGAPPILVIGSTGDPATPYEWSKALAAQLDRGALLTRDGHGHGAILMSRCIDRWATRYFVRSKTPPPGTICAE